MLSKIKYKWRQYILVLISFSLGSSLTYTTYGSYQKYHLAELIFSEQVYRVKRFLLYYEDLLIHDTYKMRIKLAIDINTTLKYYEMKFRECIERIEYGCTPSSIIRSNENLLEIQKSRDNLKGKVKINSELFRTEFN